MLINKKLLGISKQTKKKRCISMPVFDYPLGSIATSPIINNDISKQLKFIPTCYRVLRYEYV